MLKSKFPDEPVPCNICNRPVLPHEIDFETNIAYCHGCNHYFPLSARSVWQREEIVIPNNASYLRLRIERDELEIRIRWRKNYKYWRGLISAGEAGYSNWLVTLAYLLNKTIIAVRAGYIKIDHVPITDIMPMAFYASHMISQLYLLPMKWHDTEQDNYGLYLKLKNGNEILLVHDMKKTTLLFIEQEIERVLKVTDTE